jgi:hypothetical protein
MLRQRFGARIAAASSNISSSVRSTSGLSEQKRAPLDDTMDIERAFVSEIDVVEVDLQDLLFRVPALDHNASIASSTLAGSSRRVRCRMILTVCWVIVLPPSTTRPCVDVAGQRAHDAAPIEAAMVEEAAVFGRQDRRHQRLRQIGEVHRRAPSRASIRGTRSGARRQDRRCRCIRRRCAALNDVAAELDLDALSRFGSALR